MQQPCRQALPHSRSTWPPRAWRCKTCPTRKRVSWRPLVTAARRAICRVDHASLHRYSVPGMEAREQRQEAMAVYRPILRTGAIGIYLDRMGTRVHDGGVPRDTGRLGWLDAGSRFELRALKEPRPTDQALRMRPDLEDAARVPTIYSSILYAADEQCPALTARCGSS